MQTPSFTGTSGLAATEVRVLGSLLEKQSTTPASYPLTLNALRMACNQSTNRDPVLDYSDEVIRDALHRLERRSFVRLASGRGSRAPKYRHLLAEALPMEEDEQAVMCVLMLRGPQTPGELKQRAERMHGFPGLAAIHDTLTLLIERGLAARLARRPGQKEERYAQLLGESSEPAGASVTALDGASATGAQAGYRAELRSVPDGAALASPVAAGAPSPSLAERVAALERDVAELRSAVDERSRRQGVPAGGSAIGLPEIDRDGRREEWR